MTKVIAAAVHTGGRVRCWLQTTAGERVYATVEDAAFTDGLLAQIAEAVEASLRARMPEPGREAIHGRPPSEAP